MRSQLRRHGEMESATPKIVVLPSKFQKIPSFTTVPQKPPVVSIRVERQIVPLVKLLPFLQQKQLSHAMLQQPPLLREPVIGYTRSFLDRFDSNLRAVKAKRKERKTYGT
jgi:hypothetical protein